MFQQPGTDNIDFHRDQQFLWPVCVAVISSIIRYLIYFSHASRAWKSTKPDSLASGYTPVYSWNEVPKYFFLIMMGHFLTVRSITKIFQGNCAVVPISLSHWNLRLIFFLFNSFALRGPSRNWNKNCVCEPILMFLESLCEIEKETYFGHNILRESSLCNFFYIPKKYLKSRTFFLYEKKILRCLELSWPKNYTQY